MNAATAMDDVARLDERVDAMPERLFDVLVGDVATRMAIERIAGANPALGRAIAAAAAGLDCAAWAVARRGGRGDDVLREAIRCWARALAIIRTARADVPTREAA